MTVSSDAGSGGGKKAGRGKKCPGPIQFKMSMMKEVLKRRNQMGKLVKKRLELNMLKEETKLEGEFQMRKMKEEMKNLKKEIKMLMKRAGDKMGEIPEVKIRLQVTFPKKAQSMLLREKDVKAENLKKLGIPGAANLEKAVAQVQSQINEVKDYQISMLGEVEKLIKTIKMLDQ